MKLAVRVCVGVGGRGHGEYENYLKTLVEKRVRTRLVLETYAQMGELY